MPPPAEGIAARLVVGPALRTQPDRRLVALVRDGYELAFEEIVRRYGKSMARYAGAIVGNRADDVTQDAFSKALLALRRDGTEIELRPWLFRIIRNAALNDLRDSPPSPELLAEAIAGGGNPAEELERREKLADLMRRLQSLPEQQRAAIVMRELEGLSHEEIATALGLSGGGARQAIYRARRALRGGLGLLLPLPLLKALLSGTAAAPMEAAAGTAGIGGGAGAGVALKAAAATVLIAGAVGAGAVVDHSHHGDEHPASRAQGIVAEDSSGSARAAAAPKGSGGGGSAEGRGNGGTEHAGSNDGGGKDGNAVHGGDSGSGGKGEVVTGSEDHGGDRGPRGSHADSGDGGGQSGSSEHSGGGGEDHHADHSLEAPSSSGDGSPGSGGGEEIGTGEDSGSDSGPGSGDSSGADGPDSEDSSDSHGGGGFSVQMEPQPEETP
jgi:RNA polymerase sigma factor (sigma-70 family)